MLSCLVPVKVAQSERPPIVVSVRQTRKELAANFASLPPNSSDCPGATELRAEMRAISSLFAKYLSQKNFSLVTHCWNCLCQLQVAKKQDEINDELES
jgi:hypothetical protein